MTLLNISTAARVSGKSRITIQRYLKNGRLSGVIDNDGHIKIDTSELLRVFGELADTDALNKVQHESYKSATDAENNVTHEQVPISVYEDIKTQLNAALEREKNLLAMLGQEQQSRREMEQKLLALPEGQNKKQGWLARLLGR
jgi:predicted site-specific integrase-resolvase